MINRSSSQVVVVVVAGMLMEMAGGGEENWPTELKKLQMKRKEKEASV